MTEDSPMVDSSGAQDTLAPSETGQNSGSGSVIQRAKRGLYLLIVTVVTAFVVGLFAVMIIEVAGPSETKDGRVIAREKGTREVTRCPQPGRSAGCRTTTYPTYSVLGERTDGTTWIVVGEGPYDAMQGERGLVEVETSTITGRVVGLTGRDTFDSTWSVSGSGITWFSIGAVVIWVPLVVAYEWRRRTGFFKLGRFVRSDLIFGAVGAAVGLTGLWFALFARTAGLDVPSSVDLYGDFLADPVSFVGSAIDGNDEPGVQTGEFVDAGRGASFATVAIEDLGPVGDLSVPTDITALPVVAIAGGGLGRFDPVEWTLAGDAAIDCPVGVPSFPEVLGNDPSITGGFVCFSGSWDGEVEVELVAGSGVFADRVVMVGEVLRS